METRWRLRPENREVSQKLGSALGIEPITAQILLNRGIQSLDQAREFLDPSYLTAVNFDSDLLDQAVTPIVSCIEQKKTIVLFGDYDVDGMTSTAIMTRCLRECGAKVSYYIPSRFEEGYGLNDAIINVIRTHQAALLITLDCGISNVNEIQKIKEKTGVTIIVMDHHTLPDILPPADIIINPKCLPPNHPMYGLCTAGIVYKFMEYFLSVYPHHQHDIEQHLDLAALGTVADVAVLVGENRRLTKLGLDRLPKSQKKGLQELLIQTGFNRPVLTARDIGFGIAPRLNAAGRMAHAKMGVELLLSNTDDDAKSMAHRLNQLNEDRRALGLQMLNEAQTTITAKPHLLDHPLLILSGKGWHTGLIGILASQLSQKYHKPAVIIGYDDTIGKASCRTFGVINIYDILKKCQDYFIDFGGHSEAAGFSIATDKIDSFKSAAYKAAASTIASMDIRAVLDVDAILPPDQIGLKLAKELEILSPFGMSNPEPVFYTNALTPIDLRTVGDGKHLKVTFTDQSGTKIYDGIGFNLASKLETLHKHSIEIAFSLEENVWNGRSCAQLKLIDLK